MKQKLWFFLCAIICVACHSSYSEEISVQEKTLNWLQSDGYFATANIVCQKNTGCNVWENICISRWDSIPVDTLTQYDIDEINYSKITMQHIDLTFAKVKPHVEYEMALRQSYDFSAQQIMDLKRNWLKLEVKDSIVQENLATLKALKSNFIQGYSDTPIYHIYHFVACATNITTAEKRFLDFGYSFYNVSNACVDTVIFIGGDVRTFLKVNNDFCMRLPVTTEVIQFNETEISNKVEEIMSAEDIVIVSKEDLRQQGEIYLQQNAERKGVKVTNSGLQYEIIKMGVGKRPTIDSQVKMRYTAKLIDGTVTDCSDQRANQILYLSWLIDGLKEGLQLMSVGSKFRFTVPYKLAYGDRASGDIPPYSVMIYEVELLGVY